jgi:hypothetical protein
VVARGQADGLALRVPPGRAAVVLEIDPAARIGPLSFEPGTLTRLRFLYFPTLDPPVREWRWEIRSFDGKREGAGAAR